MNKKIILEVNSGIVSFADESYIPEGIEIEIRDYDCEGTEEEYLIKDKEGYRYLEYHL